MKLSQFKKNLIPSLDRLSDEKQIGFGAACCERLLPNYLDFQNEENWGDAEALRLGLNLAWNKLENQHIEPAKIKLCIEQCEHLAPESDGFNSLLVTAAQDACFAICSLLDSLINHSSERIAQTAEYATDSVDLFVQVSLDLDPNHPGIEETILSTPLMQQELLAQYDDLEILNSSENWMLELSDRWRDKGKGNLKIL